MQMLIRKFKKIVANKRGVDIRGLQVAVIGMVSVFVTTVLGVILIDNMNQNAITGVNDNTVNSTIVQTIITNSTDVLGDVVTTWGNIILLGVVAVTIFIGVLAALNFLTARQGR